ncbi:hypothetical protein TWF730_007335 [Orbilia blumenaviensis]|uniref:Uncharacterized protein n=1 Tax=Orbilia blumenaviensis TaxID=1796055 RepID=A0AAV9VAR3_9PEZI
MSQQKPYNLKEAQLTEGERRLTNLRAELEARRAEYERLRQELGLHTEQQLEEFRAEILRMSAQEDEVRRAAERTAAIAAARSRLVPPHAPTPPPAGEYADPLAAARSNPVPPQAPDPPSMGEYASDVPGSDG